MNQRILCFERTETTFVEVSRKQSIIMLTVLCPQRSLFKWSVNSELENMQRMKFNDFLWLVIFEIF